MFVINWVWSGASVCVWVGWGGARLAGSTPNLIKGQKLESQVPVCIRLELELQELNS